MAPGEKVTIDEVYRSVGELKVAVAQLRLQIGELSVSFASTRPRISWLERTVYGAGVAIISFLVSSFVSGKGWNT